MPKPIDISASRGAMILGISPHKSTVGAWLEIMEDRKPGFCAKHKYTPPPEPDNAATEWGVAFEDAVIHLTEEKREDKIINREQFIQTDFLTCHLDGQYEKSENIHEGKTTSQYYFRDNFGSPGSDLVPISYQVQAQHQMLLKNKDKCILSVLVFPKRQSEFEIDLAMMDCKKWATVLDEMGYFHQYEISANNDLQLAMIKKYIDFWEKYVLTEKEPPVGVYADFAMLVKNPQGTVLSNEQVERWASEYKQINAETSELSKRKDQLKVLILNYMREQDKGVDKILDDDSREKWVLRDRRGHKLFQYNGKTFR